MAPSRRKGAGKAASTAAIRRQWNVGDLVLAKVKGYPAWPATVSEPEKWGYPADQKKALVHFFGTQQIAFCNPADVEEFTDEKKTCLLGKRHGKGADFVRAVNEIIACFEKLKQKDRVNIDNGTEDSVNGNNTQECFSKCVKNYDPSFKSESYFPESINDLNSLTEAAVAVAAEDTSHDKTEEAHSNLVLREAPVSTSYSTRSKTDVSQSRHSVAQRRISNRRLRTPRKDSSSGVQKVMLPSIRNTRSSRLNSDDASHGKFFRRSNRIMKSPYDTEGCDQNSPDFVSNDSTEDDDSGIMSMDSDTPSFNGGSTVESHSKPPEVEPFSENNERDADLNDKIEFQKNTALVKKRREPKVKKYRDNIIVAAKLNEAVSDMEMQRVDCVSPNSNHKLSQIYAGEDGDDHLPLVKRARVRKGKMSPVGEEKVPLAFNAEKILKGSECTATQSVPLNCEVDNPCDVVSVSFQDPANIPLLHLSPTKKPQFLEGRMHFADGEAALPPSKRLNRALEAMSANVAEDCQKAAYYLMRDNSIVNAKDSFIADCTEGSMETKAVVEMRSGSVENHGYDDSGSGASEFCVQSKAGLSEIESKPCIVDSDCVNTSINKMIPESHENLTEHAEGADCKCLQSSPSHANPDDEPQPAKSNSPNIGEVTRVNDNTSHFMSLADCRKIDNAELNEGFNGSGPDVSMINSELTTVEKISGGSLNVGAGIQISKCEGEGKDDETFISVHQAVAKNSQHSQRSEFLQEANSASKDSNFKSSVTHGKVNWHNQHLVKSISAFDDRLEDQTVSVIQSSSSLTDGGPDCVSKESPPSSSACNVSGSEKKNYLDDFNSCSTDTQVHSKMENLAGKSSCKREALSSFESIIRSLTRTKESIGRATRIAIECAKYGFADKVVEILALNLERESNPHKKVDLFFLVDSITQCSRGIKGDDGTYPSAIQAQLPRLLLAAAPPASGSFENHRQCLKVLSVWQERKILPESVLHRHIRELDSLCCPYPTGGSRRPLRNERAFDDPIREMEGILVDEYGSNSSFQLADFCMPPMLRDDDGGSDSDGENFEAVTPEHKTENFDADKTPISTFEKRRRILEDVDGELEMEDVAPCCEAEIISTRNIAGDYRHVLHLESDSGPPFSSQQPEDVSMKHASLHTSTNPPPLQPNGFHHAAVESVSNGSNSNICPSSQNLDSHPIPKQSVLPRSQPTTLDSECHRVHDKFFQSQVPRWAPDYTNTCSFGDRTTSHMSARGSNRTHPADNAFSNGLHLHPPHPAPSNQFSYVQEQQFQPRRDVPPPSHPNRLNTRDAVNGNSYRDRGRNKFVRRDNGDCWRPPFPSNSGPCYRNGARMAHYPLPYDGPPREPSFNDNRWNFPPRPVNHRQFHPYRHPSDAPIPVTSRGPNLWRPR